MIAGDGSDFFIFLIHAPCLDILVLVDEWSQTHSYLYLFVDLLHITTIINPFNNCKYMHGFFQNCIEAYLKINKNVVIQSR